MTVHDVLRRYDWNCKVIIRDEQRPPDDEPLYHGSVGMMPRELFQCVRMMRVTGIAADYNTLSLQVTVPLPKRKRGGIQND